jgi:uncharacterized protein YbjT (DUF2867 family)
MTTLITGGSGTLGRQLVPLLPDAVVLSRTRGDRRGDLATGAGLDRALDGVDTVVHLAAGTDQEGEARNLLAAASEVRHIVFISIVGIDRIPFGYYRQKLAAERLIVESPIPSTVLRTTQFHEFAANLFAAQRYSPVLFTPSLSVQPIDTRVVAARLAELVAGGPSGRVADLGGPEMMTGREMATLYRAHRGWRKPLVPLALPGKTFAAFAAGHQLAPGNRAGGRTFGEFLGS